VQNEQIRRVMSSSAGAARRSLLPNTAAALC
jgi:hypothetical protein